jgi:hypothetical protein
MIHGYHMTCLTVVANGRCHCRGGQTASAPSRHRHYVGRLWHHPGDSRTPRELPPLGRLCHPRRLQIFRHRLQVAAATPRAHDLLDPINWFGSTPGAIVSVLIIDTWGNLPFVALIYPLMLGGRQTFPVTVEAIQFIS